MTDDLKIDTQIIDIIGETPGMSPHRIATILICNFSTTYTKTRISYLVATGRIRAVTDPAGRSKLHLPDAPLQVV
jgi:hypothetical protein